ncbi:uncharacterized protein DKFZp434B061-like [Phymastichus coffea]|uniref:uncharacterized protein DKFZp434B061-like n=1 Tax=Phymastichus coffea TaxID=108790 RepID=UPI00273CACE2|nr:uncharacterized protein DKFZp434B061-like [Phymastichus coffea]
MSRQRIIGWALDWVDLVGYRSSSMSLADEIRKLGALVGTDSGSGGEGSAPASTPEPLEGSAAGSDAAAEARPVANSVVEVSSAWFGGSVASVAAVMPSEPWGSGPFPVRGSGEPCPEVEDASMSASAGDALEIGSGAAQLELAAYLGEEPIPLATPSGAPFSAVRSLPRAERLARERRASEALVARMVPVEASPLRGRSEWVNSLNSGPARQALPLQRALANLAARGPRQEKLVERLYAGSPMGLRTARTRGLQALVEPRNPGPSTELRCPGARNVRPAIRGEPRPSRGHSRRDEIPLEYRFLPASGVQAERTKRVALPTVATGGRGLYPPAGYREEATPQPSRKKRSGRLPDFTRDVEFRYIGEEPTPRQEEFPQCRSSAEPDASGEIGCPQKETVRAGSPLVGNSDSSPPAGLVGKAPSTSPSEARVGLVSEAATTATPSPTLETGLSVPASASSSRRVVGDDGIVYRLCGDGHFRPVTRAGGRRTRKGIEAKRVSPACTAVDHQTADGALASRCQLPRPRAGAAAAKQGTPSPTSVAARRRARRRLLAEVRARAERGSPTTEPPVLPTAQAAPSTSLAPETPLPPVASVTPSPPSVSPVPSAPRPASRVRVLAYLAGLSREDRLRLVEEADQVSQPPAREGGQ